MNASISGLMTKKLVTTLQVPPPSIFDGEGTQNFWSPSVPDRDELGWGRGRLAKKKKKKSDWSQNCPLNAKLGHFCYFKHEIQLFKPEVLLSLTEVKFDTKMYLNFSNFREQTSAGVGDKPWSKNRDMCRMGDKISPDRGDPQVLQEKTLHCWHYICHLVCLFIRTKQKNKNENKNKNKNKKQKQN